MDPSIFGTPGTTNSMAATARSTGLQDTPLVSRFGGNGSAMFPSSGMASGMVDLAFQGSMVDGTIHVACITQAGPEMLVRSQNAAYIAATHQIESLSRQIQSLEGQLAGQKQALAEVLSKVPILLGITGTEGRESPSLQARCACTGKAVLGLGLEYPTVPTTRPPGMTYWAREDYHGRPAKGGKAGQHKSDENVGQIWIEDEHGQVIDGGQATYHSRELPHEARVFIHMALGRHFPFLLICQGGQWKINELIIQNYSSFAKTHISKDQKGKKKSTGTRSSGKRPRADSNSAGSVGGTDAPPPAKAPRSSAEDPSHGLLVPSASSTSSVSNPTSHPLLEPGNELYVFDDTSRTHSVSPPPAPLVGTSATHAGDEPTSPPTSSSPSPSTSLPSLPSMSNPLVSIEQEIENGVLEEGLIAQVSATGSSSSSVADVPDTSVSSSNTRSASTTGLPQIPTPKPFPVTIRHAEKLVEAPLEPASANANSPVPESLSSSTDGVSTSAPPLTQPQAPVDQSMGTSTAAVPSGRRRGPPPTKASAKYKPETISMQSFHMRDRIDENPDVTFAECQELYKKLSPEQLQVYQDEVATAKKERNGHKKKST